MNQASCSCGCCFCARCGALYIAAPEAAAGLAAVVVPGLLGASSGLWATCSCGAVDKAAVATRWGSAAVACWPSGAPQQQLLLLHLLLAYQAAAIPLLSQQLLQTLQEQAVKHAALAAAVLQWENVQQVAHSIAQQQQQVGQGPLAGDPCSEQQEGGAQQADVHLIPTDATPTFVLDGQAAAAAAAQDAMEVDPAPSPAKAAAVTLKKAEAADASQPGSASQQHPSLQQQPLPAAWPQQQRQQSLHSELLVPDEAAAELEDVLEAEQLLDLAAELAQPQPPVAADLAPLQPGAHATAEVGSHGRQEQYLVQISQATEVEPDEQLSLDDLVDQQQSEPMQWDELGLQQPQQQQRQQPGSVLLMGPGVMLAGKGGRLRLVTGDTMAANDESKTEGAAAAVVPQLSDFGLKPEAPPVLPDEPVVLLNNKQQEAGKGQQLL